MWVIRYQNTLEGGTINSISCCLQASKSYSIGRSSKNALTIKNDKSISRQHITFKWENNNNSDLKANNISLINQGKLTSINKKFLKVGETFIIDARKALTNTYIELGTTPVHIEVGWMSQTWNIPTSLAPYQATLSQFGVSTESFINESPTDLVISDFPTSDDNGIRELHALINNIPLKKSLLLVDLCDSLLSASVMHLKFDEMWNDMVKSSKFNVFNFDPKILSSKFMKLNSIIILTNLGIESQLSTILKRFDVKLSDFHNMNSLYKYANSLNPSAKYLILTSTNKTENGQILCNIKCFITSIMNDTLPSITNTKNVSFEVCDNSKFEKVSEGVSTTSKKTIHPPEIEASPVILKKRKMNRRRVQPLDSLNFFAGGLNAKPPSEHKDFASTEKHNSSTNSKITISSPTIGGIDEKSSSIVEKTRKVDEDILKESDRNKAGFTIVSSPDIYDVDKNEGPGNNFSQQSPPTVIRPGSQNSSVNAAFAERMENSTTTEDYKCSDGSTQNAVKTFKENCEPSAYSQKQIPHSQGDLLNLPSKELSLKEKSNTPQSFVEVIQQTKNREVKRVKSTIVELEDDELSEEAINQLKNLAIVEPNNDLLREGYNLSVNRTRSKARKSENTAMNKEWQKRKNFKTFVKVWPKSKKQNEGNNPDSDFIRNAAFLITRSYVPLKKYSKKSKATKWGRENNEDMFALTEMENLGSNTDMPDNTATGKIQHKPHTQNIFVNEDTSDDGREQSFFFSRSSDTAIAVQPEKNRLFVTGDDNDDENDVVNDSVGGFQLASVTKTNMQPNTSDGPSRINRHGLTALSGSQEPKAFDSDGGEDGDDGDDDDDEGPRFKFKRKKR